MVSALTESEVFASRITQGDWMMLMNGKGVGKNSPEHHAGGAGAVLTPQQTEQEKPSTSLRDREAYNVAVAQITTTPGQIKENTRKIIAEIERARSSGASLVVFPELTIPGYHSMDLLFNPTYLKENKEALEEIRKASAGITVVVGFVDYEEGQSRPGGRPQIYNSAAVIHDGVLIGVRDKTLYPTYDIFFEERYFAPARDERRVFEVDGVRLGVEICEDLWKDGYSVDVTKELAAKGADIVINISASPFSLGKLPVREELLQRATREHQVPIVYANLIGGFDGYDGEVVFDGRSMVVAEDGRLLGMGKFCSEDLLLVDIKKKAEVLSFPAFDRVAELHDALLLEIREYFRRNGTRPDGSNRIGIIGLSGGIDSAVVAALAAEALGPQNVLAISMPSRYSSDETKSDAETIARHLGTQFKTIPIEQPFRVLHDFLRSDPEVATTPEDVGEENLQARLRMMYLMYYANKLGGVVLGTGNRTEIALNNCTIYGDMVAGLGVLQGVDKDDVYALAADINARAGRAVIPTAVIERTPSAELKPNQSDADVMGALPQIIAPLVRGIIEDNLSLAEALERYEGSFSRGLIESTFRKIDLSEWKRRQAAPGIRVSKHDFGIGRRMPMNHGYQG